MRARWINQRPAAIFDVCPHLRRRDLENVRQFVPKEDFFICSQPLANLPELVLSAIICRIDSCWADVSADIARAAVLASALAAPKTESKRAVSSCSFSRARRSWRSRAGRGCTCKCRWVPRSAPRAAARSAFARRRILRVQRCIRTRKFKVGALQRDANHQTRRMPHEINGWCILQSRCSGADMTIENQTTHNLKP